MTPSVIVALHLFPFLSLSFTLMLRELGLSRLGFSKASRRVSTNAQGMPNFETCRNLSLSWMDLGEVPEILRRPTTVSRRQAIKGKRFGLYKSQLGRSRIFSAWNRSTT